MPPLINVRSISKAFGAEPLFQNVSFTVSEGDRIGLIGPNGSGKSTLLRILAGTENTDDGEIAFRKRLRLSYVEQESEFQPGDTVRAVVDAALKSSAVPESERGTRFAETLGRAGFVDLEAEATSLSGGWQKRLAIVEALVQAPDILLLDEPTAGLDPITSGEIDELILKLQKEHAMASIVVTHDLQSAKTIAGRLALLHEGNVILEGTFADLEKSHDKFVSDFMRRDA